MPATFYWALQDHAHLLFISTIIIGNVAQLALNRGKVTREGLDRVG